MMLVFLFCFVVSDICCFVIVAIDIDVAVGVVVRKSGVCIVSAAIAANMILPIGMLL